MRGNVGRTLRLAMWFALVTAAAEVGARVFAKVFMQRPFSYGPQMAWMTPLADVVMFAAAAAIATLAARLWPRSARLRVLLTCLVFLSCLSVLLLVPRIAVWAQVLLAAGLAAQIAALLASRAAGFELLVRRTVPAMLSGAIVSGGLAAGVPLWREQRMVAALPPAAPGAPNVLLIIWDTVRASSLSLYGYAKSTTPHLERFAARGVAFGRAVAPAPYTLASHASFFTGRWAHELSTDWEAPLDDSHPTLADVLSRAGYRTGAFSANSIYVTREYGMGRGFAHFREHSQGLREVIRASTLARRLVTGETFRRLTRFDDNLGRVSAPEIGGALAQWLARDKPRPWFAFLNMMEAHSPYLPAPPYDTLFGWYNARTPSRERREARALARQLPWLITRQQARGLQPAYDGAIATLDAATGALLEQLGRQGRLVNTLVVVAADHGEEFGEHSVFGHGNSLYLQSLHVPLVIVFPGHVPQRLRIARTVSLRDLPATVLDLIGAPGMLPGHSLRQLWSADSAAFPASPALAEVRRAKGLPDRYPVSVGDLATAVTDSFQLIRDGYGQEEVWDLAMGPTGDRPAVASPAALASLRALLPPARRP